MDLIKLEQKGEILVVDSRLIAIELGIQHKTLMETIRKYQDRIEKKGQLTFETEAVTNSVGAVNEVKFAYLNERQATFVLTLSRNTERVVELKDKLEESFYQAKQLLQQRPIQQPVERILPTRDAVDYIEAGYKLQAIKDGMLKQLLNDALIDQISLEQNLKYLPVTEKPKQYTIVKVRAKQLGFTDKQIGDGSALGRFVKKMVEPAFQEMIGKYPVHHYEINQNLDNAITTYFS